MTLPVAVLAALTASAAAPLTPSHGYAASFAGGRPIAAAVVRDGAHQDLQFRRARVAPRLAAVRRDWLTFLRLVVSVEGFVRREYGWTGQLARRARPVGQSR